MMSDGCLIDPIKSKWCMSIDLLVHAICTCVFKGERINVYKWVSVVQLVMSEVVIVLQSKSIKLFRDVATGPKLSLTTDHMFFSSEKLNFSLTGLIFSRNTSFRQST